MTQEQINEAMKVVQLLNECREHLDNARYNMGEVSDIDPHFLILNEVHELICSALDKL